MKQITPYLMFKKDAEKAVALYVSVFPQSKVIKTTHWSKLEIDAMKKTGFPEDQLPGAAGSVKTVSFEINGQRFEASRSAEGLMVAEHPPCGSHRRGLPRGREVFH